MLAGRVVWILLCRSLCSVTRAEISRCVDNNQAWYDWKPSALIAKRIRNFWSGSVIMIIVNQEPLHSQCQSLILIHQPQIPFDIDILTAAATSLSFGLGENSNPTEERQLTHNFVACLRNVPDENTYKKYIPPDLSEESKDADAHAFGKALWDFKHPESSLLITKDKLIGCWVSRIRPGNIGIGLGCTYPLILRPNGDQFSIRGYSYVHGIMYGERRHSNARLLKIAWWDCKITDGLKSGRKRSTYVSKHGCFGSEWWTYTYVYTYTYIYFMTGVQMKTPTLPLKVRSINKSLNYIFLCSTASRQGTSPLWSMLQCEFVALTYHTLYPSSELLLPAWVNLSSLGTWDINTASPLALFVTKGTAQNGFNYHIILKSKTENLMVRWPSIWLNIFLRFSVKSIIFFEGRSY